MKMIKHLTSLSKWTAVLALLIASVAASAMAQETGTVKISGRFSMDYLSGESDLYYFDPDLLAVYYNGHEHTWTLTLHGTSQSHLSNGSYYGTEIHSTSFDLEFFGPDAATLNGIVSKHLAGMSVNVYLQNTYYSYGGGFAIMHVGVGEGVTGQLYFYTGQEMGSLTLFPAGAGGYPVVRPEPFSIEPDITEFSEFEMFSGTGFNMQSLAGPVTFEGSVGSASAPSADGEHRGLLGGGRRPRQHAAKVHGEPQRLERGDSQGGLPHSRWYRAREVGLQRGERHADVPARRDQPHDLGFDQWGSQAGGE